MEQIIWDVDRYILVDGGLARGAGLEPIPEEGVYDDTSGRGRIVMAEFPGQCYVATRRSIHYGIAVLPCEEPADLDDIPDDVYYVEGRWYREATAEEIAACG